MTPGVYISNQNTNGRQAIIDGQGGSPIMLSKPSVAPSYVTDGLLIYLDAGNVESYPGSGTTWTDLTGNGYNSTLVNSPTYSNTDGGVLQFNGSNNYATITGLDLRRDFSLEIWVKINAFATFGPNFFGQGISDTNQSIFTCHFVDGATLLYRMYSNDYDLTLSPATPTNTWTQYIFTYTHSSPYTKKVYRDGILKGTSGPQGQYAGTGIFYIGTSYGLNSNLNGNIAISRIYTKVLSDVEALKNYNADKSRFGL